jgi:cytosine/adenosine deaminase-related metal-dependent hydrolase
MEENVTTLLVKHADVLVTMDDSRREIEGGAVLVEENRVAWVGSTAEIEPWLADNRPDLVRDGFLAPDPG